MGCSPHKKFLKSSADTDAGVPMTQLGAWEKPDLRSLPRREAHACPVGEQKRVGEPQLVRNNCRAGKLLLGLEWTNTVNDPQLRLFLAVETNGGTLYLTATNMAEQQTKAPSLLSGY
jgi:hypothetical protein